jgi:oxygen-dependent protoporphyrinogen oxidase
MTLRRVAVIGAGMTGLAFAHRLTTRSHAEGLALELRVFEAAPRAGGHAHTRRQDGFTIEAGPNGWLDRHPAPGELVAELGLGGEIVHAAEAAKRRFVVRAGRLRRAPDGPSTLLSSDALSLPGRLRVLAEAFVPARRDGGEETIAAFARRRLGAEAAGALVDPMIAGITAGDSRALSLDAAFPLMRELEQTHGSLIRGFAARRSQGVGPPHLVTLRGGMSALVDALVTALDGRVALGAPVAGMARADGGEAWRVALEDRTTWDADAVVLAAPAHAAARIVRGLDGALADLLAGVRFAGVAVVGLGYRAQDVPHALDGYGYLMTRAEHRATLGVVWESSLFEGRAPDGHVLFRAILGGERRPDVATMPSDAIVALARAELDAVLGTRADPVLHGAVAWPNAIAQYVMGHAERVSAARARAAQWPGLELCGTSYDGNSFASAIASGRAAADALLQRKEATA